MKALCSQSPHFDPFDPVTDKLRGCHWTLLDYHEERERVDSAFGGGSAQSIALLAQSDQSVHCGTVLRLVRLKSMACADWTGTRDEWGPVLDLVT
jgi:hypothetical protein